MSKTYSDQLDKAKVLIAGLRRNYEQIRNRGISLENLTDLENAISEAEILNGEVERLRSEINEALAAANKKLITIKDRTLEYKRIVKRYNDMSKWADFGVMDKR
ncbi:hypothetical protein [Phocaeicola sp.]|jgi:hypothetical protein|uniref:hypothetical protein n=1 Tax=Phocaeicola sp. TaxID=2773926 RepID=UPI003AEFCD93